MKTSSRRNFLKKVAVTAASAVAVPGLVKAASELGAEGMDDALAASAPGHGGLIVPKGEGLRITGTFLDEISHDIPHQNWGEKEWDADFRHMKSIGIDTVIGIRSGYRKFITYPSPYLLKKGCYMPSVDLLDLFLRLADKYGMQCWTNAESFDRDMPIKFLPIKFDKLRMKLEAARRAGYDKAITFEFSHFMSPQSAYLQAGHLFDRYKEYFNIR